MLVWLSSFVDYFAEVNPETDDTNSPQRTLPTCNHSFDRHAWRPPVIPMRVLRPPRIQALSTQVWVTKRPLRNVQLSLPNARLSLPNVRLSLPNVRLSLPRRASLSKVAAPLSHANGRMSVGSFNLSPRPVFCSASSDTQPGFLQRVVPCDVRYQSVSKQDLHQTYGYQSVSKQDLHQTYGDVKGKCKEEPEVGDPGRAEQHDHVSEPKVRGATAEHFIIHSPYRLTQDDDDLEMMYSPSRLAHSLKSPQARHARRFFLYSPGEDDDGDGCELEKIFAMDSSLSPEDVTMRG